jgi:hypothetical protein
LPRQQGLTFFKRLRQGEEKHMNTEKYMKTKYMNVVRSLLIGVALLIAAPGAHAICAFNENFGKVSRIYPQFNVGTYFQLKGGTTNALNPGSGSYYLIPITPDTPATHSLYRSLHDLIVGAAETGLVVKVRTSNCASRANIAPVVYLVVDYPN